MLEDIFMKTTISLGQLALQVPGATRVLRKYHLDFCCGGKKSFDEACKNQNLDMNEILMEIEALESFSDKSEWVDKPLPEIINHIVSYYHDRLRMMFPELILLAEKVERVHSEHGLCPKGLALKLGEIHNELLSHMMKEENVLFPMIKNEQFHHTSMPITIMQEEHNSHGENLIALRQMAYDFNPPEEACGTWRALYKGLDQLEMELMEHIHLENNTLFVRAIRV